MPGRPSRKRKAPQRLSGASVRRKGASTVTQEQVNSDTATAVTEQPAQPVAQPPQPDVAATLQSMQQQISTLQQTVLDLAANRPVGEPVPTQSNSEGETIMAHDQGDRACHLNTEVQSNTVPVGGLLDPKLKSKIWSKQYIDLELLLAPGKETVTLKIQKGEDAPSFCFDEKATKHIEGIHQWTSAFILYAGVYIERHLSEAPAVLHYMQAIRGMASALPVAAWKKYDEAFRKNRALTDHPWDKRHHDLYLDAVMTSTAANTPRGPGGKLPFRPSRPSGDKFPKGYCHQFCATGRCTRDQCRYSHMCPKCKGHHQASKCNKGQGENHEDYRPRGNASGNHYYRRQ